MQSDAGGAGAAGAGGTGGISEDDLKRALHAFKRRLKLTKLDQESGLGAHKPMTGGKKIENLSIMPPNDFPREVWKELAKQGKLKDSGGGFYTLP